MRSIGDILRTAGSAPAVLRFAFRLLLLCAFAMFGSQGFAHSLATLLTLATLYCAFVAAERREPVLAPGLTHWDEAAIYLMISRLLLITA